MSLIAFCQVFYLCRGPQFKYAGRCCAGRCEKIRTWIRYNFWIFPPSATEVREKCIKLCGIIALVRSHDLLVLLLAKDHLRPLKFFSLVFTEVSMFCDSLLSTVKNYPRYNYCVLVLWMSRLSRFLIAGTAAGSPLTTWDTNPVRHIYYYLPTMLIHLLNKRWHGEVLTYLDVCWSPHFPQMVYFHCYF